MTLPAFLYEALGEFKDKAEVNDLKVSTCFLWNVWSKLAEEPDIVPLIDGISSDFFARLYDDRFSPPEKPLLRNLWNRPTDGERLQYLILETVRVQWAAHALTNVIRGRTRPVHVPTISALLRVPNEFYVLRRRGGDRANQAALRHTRMPRCVYPDLQIIPTHLSEKIGIDLHFLPEGNGSVKLELKPTVYSTGASYRVNLDQRATDTYFRIERIVVGAADRTREFWEVMEATKAGDADQGVVLVWPELAIDETMATEICRRAQERTDPDAHVADPRRSLGRKMAVAGTFHGGDSQTVDLSPTTITGVANRALLLDAESGELVLEQDKFRPFKNLGISPPLVEAIAPADKLTIGVADWGTFCILICKDFVDDRAPLVKQLDVDYVLVPSMGNTHTESAWKRQAESLKRRWGSRSALALQAPPVCGGEVWTHVVSGEDIARVT